MRRILESTVLNLYETITDSEEFGRMLKKKARLISMLGRCEHPIQRKCYRLRQLENGCPVFNEFLLLTPTEAEECVQKMRLTSLKSLLRTLEQFEVVTLERTLDGLLVDLSYTPLAGRQIGVNPDKISGFTKYGRGKNVRE